MNLKSALKAFIPKQLLEARTRLINSHRRKEFAGLGTEEAFTRIYLQKLWGSADASPFCSGNGSSDVLVVATYVAAVTAYLGSLSRKPNVVDLGCGDFAVGSQIRPYTDQYVACDIVRPLVEYNREKFAGLNVDFRVCNILKDELPSGDIVFVRQVLQHLSNQQISDLIPRLRERFAVMIVTEHLPLSNDFTPNLDKSTGPDIRLGAAAGPSGVVLSAPPFSIKGTERELCTVQADDGRIRTLLFEFEPA